MLDKKWTAIEGSARKIYQIPYVSLPEAGYYDSSTFIEYMNQILREEAIYSVDQNICFCDLSAWADNYLNGTSQEEMANNRIPTREYTSGFSDEYVDGDGKKFRWCDGNGVITINNL